MVPASVKCCEKYILKLHGALYGEEASRFSTFRHLFNWLVHSRCNLNRLDATVFSDGCGINVRATVTVKETSVFVSRLFSFSPCLD